MCVSLLCVIALCTIFPAIYSFQQGLPLKGKCNKLTMHFDEAINGKTGAKLLSADRYLATNRFRVRESAMPKFEKRWAERKSRLATLTGFRFFSLFKRVSVFGIDYNDKDDEFGNYISFTYWETKKDFDAWRTGEAFKEAHGGGGITDFVKLLSTALFILKGSPKPAFYDALLVKSGETLSFATDNGWRNVKADGETYIEPDVFMAQNKFKVISGKEEEFEKRWASRESQLQKVPGFVGFSLLRRDADKADDGFNYISCSIWRSKEAFEAWRSSPEFQLSHTSSRENEEKLYEGGPRLAFYEGKLALSSDNGI